MASAQKEMAALTAVKHIRSSRIRGAVVGVCVADALGGPVQFQQRGTFPPVEDLRRIEHFDKPAGYVPWNCGASVQTANPSRLARGLTTAP
jgi:ADP-ribosylglycohydrolase